ncbi:hypothetical protein MLD38_031711 [Melastoma candidum]|uniref:Uncharacterized protein n=1 Tax=Melastoma candidum TaxID=119954 RepID=A0ACB9MV64_9MYRT|nr:hypothetical protein MLD38_031711 [Melastoma candidum]
MTTTTPPPTEGCSFPLIINDHSSMRKWSRTVCHRQGLTLLLVPTMVTSTEDLSTYPRDFLGDLEKFRVLGCVNAVFCPRDLYDYGDAGVVGLGGMKAGLWQGRAWRRGSVGTRSGRTLRVQYEGLSAVEGHSDDGSRSRF